MSDLNLRWCWEDFFVLDGGRNWADVEGHADEWRAIAKALRERRVESFKRCAVHFSPGGGVAILRSPRNACSDNDEVPVAVGDVDALAARIDRVLDAYAKEPTDV